MAGRTRVGEVKGSWATSPGFGLPNSEAFVEGQYFQRNFSYVVKYVVTDFYACYE